jgi:hypothetical protein
MVNSWGAEYFLMKKLLYILVLAMTPIILLTTPLISAQAAPPAPPSCSTSFFGFPTWYEYLTLGPYPDCSVQINEKVVSANGKTVNQGLQLTDIWLIVLAIIDILMTLAGVLAVVYVIVGGFKLVTSQAAPDKIANAKQTITYALVGLVIAVVASQIVGFIAGKLHG